MRTTSTTKGGERRKAALAAALHDPTARDALKKFRILYGTAQHHYRVIERACGIGGAQLWALAEIARNPGMSVRNLTAAMIIHQSTASNLIDRLEGLRLVTKRRAKGDRRIVELFATGKALRLLERAPGPAIGVLPDALQRMPRRALTALSASLDALLGAMKDKNPRTATTPLADM